MAQVARAALGVQDAKTLHSLLEIWDNCKSVVNSEVDSDIEEFNTHPVNVLFAEAARQLANPNAQRDSQTINRAREECQKIINNAGGTESSTQPLWVTTEDGRFMKLSSCRFYHYDGQPSNLEQLRKEGTEEPISLLLSVLR
jgi:hypothetical protein